MEIASMLAALLFSTAMMLDPAAAPAQPAPSTTGAPVQVATTKPAKAPSDRICKLEPVLGSKITKKVCYDRTQMEERTFYDKQNLDLLQAATPAMNR